MIAIWLSRSELRKDWDATGRSVAATVDGFTRSCPPT